MVGAHREPRGRAQGEPPSRLSAHAVPIRAPAPSSARTLRRPLPASRRGREQPCARSSDAGDPGLERECGGREWSGSVLCEITRSGWKAAPRPRAEPRIPPPSPGAAAGRSSARVPPDARLPQTREAQAPAGSQQPYLADGRAGAGGGGVRLRLRVARRQPNPRAQCRRLLLLLPAQPSGRGWRAGRGPGARPALPPRGSAPAAAPP